MAFLFFILFNWVLTKLQDAFYRFFSFKIIFEIWPVKARDYKRFLVGKLTKTAKKNLYPPTFFEKNTLSSTKCSLIYFKNLVREFKKSYKKNHKKQFFLILCYNFFFFSSCKTF